LKIKRIITGDLLENCYILVEDNNVLVVDPGSDIEKILKEIKNYNLVGILITHYHFDHVGVLNDLIKYREVPIYNFKSDKNINIDNFSFEIIKTPGHTSDSVTFYFKKYNTMFTGDFIFKRTIGRTDLETGSFTEMKKSIEKIKNYDANIILYPGHGDDTTLEEEIKYNYFFT